MDKSKKFLCATLSVVVSFFSWVAIVGVFGIIGMAVFPDAEVFPTWFSLVLVFAPIVIAVFCGKAFYKAYAKKFQPLVVEAVEETPATVVEEIAEAPIEQEVAPDPVVEPVVEVSATKEVVHNPAAEVATTEQVPEAEVPEQPSEADKIIEAFEQFKLSVGSKQQEQEEIVQKQAAELRKIQDQNSALISALAEQQRLSVQSDTIKKYQLINADQQATIEAQAAQIQAMQAKNEALQKEMRDRERQKKSKEFLDKQELVNTELLKIDLMEGHDFEHWCAEALKSKGFTGVQVTPGSGDQGVDVVAEKDGITYAIQCKRYSSDLGNTPVQEVHSGKDFYHRNIGVVLTNRYFTTGAIELAEKTGTLLWDRNWIIRLLEERYSLDIPAVSKTLAEAIGTGAVDKHFVDAVDMAIQMGYITVSLVQNLCQVDMARASLIVDQMEDFAIIGSFNAGASRTVLITREQWDEIRKSL